MKATSADVSRICDWMQRRLKRTCPDFELHESDPGFLYPLFRTVIRYSRMKFGTVDPGYSAIHLLTLRLLGQDQDIECHPESIGGNLLQWIGEAAKDQ